MKRFTSLQKLNEKDHVAIISPSEGLPGVFPWVQDLGLERMRNIFGLVPKEYPTTRENGSSLRNRARDVMNAFSDKNNKAVFATIGGSDQIMLIKHLDPQVFLDNPKPFFGYSDNTHLHNFLWNLGIPSYYGGGVMNQFGMNHEMYDITIRSLKRALFEVGEFELEISDKYNDEGLDWSDRSSLVKSRKLEDNEGLVWDGPMAITEGILWGGCVESLVVQCATNKYLPNDQDLEGTILVLETAEDIPEHWIVEYLLMGFGERGWFDRFQGVLVGRPKAWEFNKQFSVDQKTEYRRGQREIVLATIRKYNTDIPIVQNVDFGHTDPQIILPLGNRVRLDGSKKKIFATY
jgi:muramoyltetrapeptide carboxypeptidase LdcA involved in peptidoglycan recycling